MLGAVTEVLGAEQGGCFLIVPNRGKIELCSEAGMVTCGSLPRERRVRWRQGREPQPVRDVLRLCGPERKQLRSRRRDPGPLSVEARRLRLTALCPWARFRRSLSLFLVSAHLRSRQDWPRQGLAEILAFPLWASVDRDKPQLCSVSSSPRWEESSLPRNRGDVRASAECWRSGCSAHHG